ncbi:outer membrane beta-barrel protein [bacterium]|nr:outer membrane beta-barrel protein [bacterium]
MKKILIILFTVVLAGSASAQGFRQLEIRGGYLNPKGTEGSFILGGSYGYSFDERVSLSLGADFFNKSYSQTDKVADGKEIAGVQPVQVSEVMKYHTFLLPFTANLDIRFPFDKGMNFYSGVGLSYQFLFNEEENFERGVKEKRNYRGFGWIFRSGIELILGSRSAIIIEAFYNSAKVKGNHDTVEGLPVWDEVNVSGLGFRAGVRLEFF